MPLINYTTQISSTKTIGEIQSMLAKAHVAHTSFTYDSYARPIMLIFELDHETYSLACRAQAILKILESTTGIPRNLRTLDQAYRVGWRIIKEWLAINLALIEMKMAESDEVFMPFRVTNPHGQETMYQAYKEHQRLLEKKS